MKTLLVLLLWAVTGSVTAQVLGTLRGAQQGSTFTYSFKVADFPTGTQYSWGIKRASDADTTAYRLGGTCTVQGSTVVVYCPQSQNALPWGDYYLFLEATPPDKARREFKYLLPISRNQLPNRF